MLISSRGIGAPVAPEQLDEVAADLWRDERLRELPPRDAATHWLLPVADRH